MLAEAGVKRRNGWVDEVDVETVGQDQRHRNVTDRSFFSMFSDAVMKSLDVSDYEGASIVHDMNIELPTHLSGIADFIFDGSCLDNIFDPARALKSMSRMLRPNGRLFCFNHATPIQSAYVCFSPEWFLDYLNANGYCDIQLFTCAFDKVLSPWKIVSWAPGGEKPARDFIIVAIAEKGAQSTNDLSPIQAHYRKLHGGGA